MSVVTATVLSAGRQIGPHCELLSIDVRREANRIPSASLVLVDGSSARREFPLSDSADFEPGKEIEIKLRYESKTTDTTVFKGPVVRHGIESSLQGSLLRVDLKDAAVKLTQARKSVVFVDKSDADSIGQIVRDAGLRVGKIATTQPVHRELVQFRCTDWDFIVTRAESQGLLATADDGVLSLRKVEFGGAPAHKFDYGIGEILDFEFEADAGGQVAEVKGSGWDVKDQKAAAASDAAPFRLSQGNLDGKKLAQSLGCLWHSAPLLPQEVKAWAAGRMMRSRLGLIRGRLAMPGFADIKLLDVIEIAGVGKRFNGKTVVTGICHRVDTEGWRTDIQFGLSAQRLGDEGNNVAEAPAAGLLPGVGGLQIGVVADFEDDPEQMRVRVMLPGIDAKPTLVWARLAAPDAGKGRGCFFRPEAGDEVVVGFINQDPRHAVVLGALHSEKNTAPDGFPPPDKDNLVKGIVTRAGTKIVFKDEDKKATLSLETASANKILLDDDQETIVISDKHGNKITLDKNGIKLDSAKNLDLVAKGDVTIEGKKVDVK